jgi:hypothetical protein
VGQAGVRKFPKLGIAKSRHEAQVFELGNNKGSAYYVGLAEIARDGEKSFEGISYEIHRRLCHKFIVLLLRPWT